MEDSRLFTRRIGRRAVLAAAVVAPFVSTTLITPTAAGAVADSPVLQIMTYNLEGRGTAGPSWKNRRPVERAMLRQAQPEIVDTQEGDHTQVKQVAADLGENYGWIGKGQNGGHKGIINAIFFDKRRLKVLGHNTFWLSATPNKAGSNTWGAKHIRTATWIHLQDKQDSGRDFYVLNTHFDNGKGQHADDVRLKSANLVGRWIAHLPASKPVLVSGDFNSAAEKTRVYTRLLNRSGLVDTWKTAATRANEYGTHTGHKAPKPNGDRIDWILSDPKVTTDHTETNIFSKDDLTPSDHLPVQAWVRLR